MASYVGDEGVQDNNIMMVIGSGVRPSSSSAATNGSLKGKQGRQWLCPHCSDVVSRGTYFRHKRAFYDHETKKWNSSQLSTTANSAGVGEASDPPLDDGRRGLVAPCVNGHDRVFIALTYTLSLLLIIIRNYYRYDVSIQGIHCDSEQDDYPESENPQVAYHP